MRYSINSEQWGHLCGCAESISSFPATIGNFLQYFFEKKGLGDFNMSYSSKLKLYSVWYDDQLNKFEAKELIDAMFNLFCHLEGI